VPRRLAHAGSGLFALAVLTLLGKLLPGINPTTVALVFLLVVLFVASVGDRASAVFVSLAGGFAFYYFFLPPPNTLTVADPQNWVALAVFLVVSVVASTLSAAARERAADAQRARLSSALLASLSHDLRTPLTAIRTAVSNLDADAIPESLRREQAHVASKEIQRLMHVFDGLLDMARIDAGAIRPRRRWVTPAEIVDAAVAQASPSLHGRELRVDAGEDAAVEIDPGLTASALVHLIENAARYADGAPMEVRGWIDGAGLRLEVRDGGPGLRPSEIERLFDPFYRGELGARKGPGTGMGLAITRGLLSADGGRVWAENVEPRGACFSIAVPGSTRAVALD
jgi:two-component system sensor histidine kinase KdpD